MTDTDVVVVGAGVAGLAAAAALRAAGRRVVVLEAARRIGGRAWTTRPPALEGVPFDHGASWLHAAEHNPLVPIAHAVGEPLRNAETTRTWRTYIGDRLATPDEHAAAEAAETSLRAALLSRARAVTEGRAPDITLAAAAGPPGPWTASILGWEGAIIAAADADVLSLRDWATNLLEGSNLSVPAGLGDFVRRVIGPPAGFGQPGAVRLGCPATAIAWTEGGVRVTTPVGRITAGACIVTASLGALAAGAIRFTPALPDPVAEAIAGLRMGLLTKVAFAATGTDRLGLPSDCGVDSRLEPGQAPLVAQFWPGGAGHVRAFLGGRAAWDLAAAGEVATADFVRERLAAMLGSSVRRALAARPAVVSGWADDPWARGAYAYAPPGAFGHRAALAVPLGRLVFAGEACRTDALAGTVGGAYLSGRDAAAHVLRSLGVMRSLGINSSGDCVEPAAATCEPVRKGNVRA